MRLFFKHVKVPLLLLLVGLYACSYLSEQQQVIPNLSIAETGDYIQLSPADTDDTKSGIIFYPGGLVDPHAYITPLKNLVLEDKRTVIIVKSSANLAIFNAQQASDIVTDHPTITKWVIGGHSLGGSTACIDAYKNPDIFVGLFLLASYSVNDLSEVNWPVLSITGSVDEVLDQTKFNDNKTNLPAEIEIYNPEEFPTAGTHGKTVYYEIVGGNHAQFGDYGEQEGDGTATISKETQHQLMRTMLQTFLNSNGL